MSNIMLKPIIILGYGGHAAEVAAAVAMSSIDGSRIEGFVDSHPEGKPDEMFGLPLLGDESVIIGRDAEVRLHIAIGDNALRMKLAGKFALFEYATLIHPSSSPGPWVDIGAGTLIASGAMLTARLEIGDHVIINTGAIISHDCEVGNFANVSPGCILSGNVKLGEGVFLGSGVTVAPGVTIGAWSQVAVGSTVTNDIPEGVIAAGSPARVAKKL